MRSPLRAPGQGRTSAAHRWSSTTWAHETGLWSEGERFVPGRALNPGLANCLPPRAAISALIWILLLASCAPAPITEAVDAGALTELASIEDLATAFNEDSGSPRLILLLSPT